MKEMFFVFMFQGHAKGVIWAEILAEQSILCVVSQHSFSFELEEEKETLNICLREDSRIEKDI